MTRRYLASGGKEEVPDNSPFIRALLKALRSKGGTDKVLTIGEILINLKEIEIPNRVPMNLVTMIQTAIFSSLQNETLNT